MIPKFPIRYNSVQYLFILSIIASIASCTTNSENKELANNPMPPNIVIIFTDDQGYGDVGIFGAKNISTPNLDQMAADGVQFTNFHVSNAVCSASRASLLTGCYSNRLGIFGALSDKSKHGLSPDETTIAEVLKPKGYATGIVGKWHLGHLEPFLPTKQGFDEFFGLPYSNDMWPYHPERPEGYPPLPLYQNESIIDTLRDQSLLTTWYTEKAVDFIDRNNEKPFFLYLAHSMPHVPLFVSDKFKGKSKAGLYGDVIMEIDWSVGQVMQALRKNGLEENTLVIFTSDNGPWLSYGTHSGSTGIYKEGKGTSWEGGIRVPAIMQWKGNIPKGKIQDKMAMTIDLLPTIAHITNAPLPQKLIDGKNIWPLIQMEKEAESPQEAYYIYYNKNELQAVISGKWKLYFPHRYRTLPENFVKPSNGIPGKYVMLDLKEMELYDLENDPSESKNVIEEYPEVSEKMSAMADNARSDMGDALQGIEGKNVRLPMEFVTAK
ncbi:sulfatase [uncultured Cyclobacterium sp.]|uniref:sulfatase family protein n=1 Tax=uncultured Cyclobacterium sp. TaxID=453820 RepID=UPI0030EF9987|tara:strand:- start:70991 stop:72466 length:1476 start_codon:yes stop_codon:yes gene_type:complete